MSSDGAIAELQAALTAKAKETAAERRHAREVFWGKVSLGLPDEWRAIEVSGGRAGLDLGLENLLTQSNTQKRFRLSQSAMACIATDAERIALSGHSLGKDIALAAAALSVAERPEIAEAAKAA